MKNKLLPLITCIALLSSCSIDGRNNLFSSTSTSSTSFELSGTVVSSIEPDESQFDSSAYLDLENTEYDAEIVLNGSAATLSNTSYGSITNNGTRVLLTQPGVFHITGTSSEVDILINKSSKGYFYLVLDDVTMTNSSSACILVYDASTTVITLVGENYLTSSYADKYTYGSSSIDGCIHAKDDLVINGEGSLNVTSTYYHGIVAKDSLAITSGKINVTAAKKAIDVNDSLAIAEASINLTSGSDGIQIENDDATSYFYMESGSLTINSGQDGIQVSPSDDATATFSGYLKIIGGEINITAGGGSSNSKDDDTSQKGLKCEGDIYLEVATFNISSADDCIHSNASISIVSGTYNLSSGDDGVHADSSLLISDGTINITKSYEGLEGYIVEINGGTIDIVSSDDGINAAGGSDTSRNDGNPWDRNTSSSTDNEPTLTINGGTINITAGGDGVDSNGSLYVTGGLLIAQSSGSSDYGLDYGDYSGDVASITGGIVFASGATGMSVNFNAGSQYSALLSLSGTKGSSISVNDDSGFSCTCTAAFSCVTYSSPYMSKGNKYTITAGSKSTSWTFSSDSYYYSNVSGGNSTAGGGPGGGGNQPGGR